MTQPEVESWREFYRMFPFDDLHRYHRPAALVAGAFGGGDIRQRLEWLQPDPRNNGLMDSDLQTMRAFGFSAKGVR